MGRLSLSAMLHALSLSLAARGASALVDLQELAKFQPYPINSTACGRPGFGPPTGAPPCPVEVCTLSRQTCAAATSARFQCFENWPCRYSPQLDALTNAARLACDQATACVESACYSSKPTSKKGDGCAVRSYFTGQCCCVNCGTPCVEAPFVGGVGQNQEAHATGAGLRIGECVAINGVVDLATIIQGHYTAKVHGIRMKQGADPLLPYEIEVDATGPLEIPYLPLGYITVNFAFTDKSGEQHGGEVQLYYPGRKVFRFAYDSTDGAIVKIEWNNGRLLPEVNYGFFGLPWAARNSFAQSARGLPPGGRYPYNDPTVVINGKSNYSEAIVSGYGVTIYSMQVLPDGPSPNNAKIVVDAQGSRPIEGLFLYFCDRAKRAFYSLQIQGTSRQVHTIPYTSSDPRIRMIFWNDYSLGAVQMRNSGCIV